MSTQDNISLLRQLAAEVQTYQVERGLSDKKLFEKLADIGSTKTYKRILDPADALDELDVAGWVKKYTSAVEYIGQLRQVEKAAEPIYEDFSNITECKAAIMRAMLEDSVARIVIIPGQTSTGKDAVKDIILAKWPAKVIAVEADEFWRDSLGAPTLALYKGVVAMKSGDAKIPILPMERAYAMIDELKKTKKILVINEAHHMGLRAINLCKTIINQTPTVIVLLCEPTLMTRLLCSSWSETSQITGNRLFETVSLPTPPADEILLLMDRRGVKFSDLSVRNQAGAELAKEAPVFGNWRFVIQVSRKLLQSGKNKPIDLKTFPAAKSDICGIRTRIIKQTDA